METLLKETIQKSRIPAKLDFYQSATGLILGLFMWAHMCLVGSIIFGKEVFYFVAKLMEASFLSSSGHGYPILVSIAALSIFIIFIVHAALAVRKFPISWQQHREIRHQVNMMNHSDTNMWYIQVITGFIMFFLGSAHLVIIMTHPDMIGPYASADRVISEWMWPMYFILLIAVELHGTIGLYRLVMKWGWFDGKNPKANRKRMQMLKKTISVFFIAVGIIALISFAKIGIEHKDNAGQRYVPTSNINK